DLAITGVGMMTPIGLSAAIAFHSVRSAVSRLSILGIPDRAQSWINGGRVFKWTGEIHSRHLQVLAEAALQQALRQANLRSDLNGRGPIAAFLGAPEEIRPGYSFPDPDVDLRDWLTSQLGKAPVHVEVLPAGASSAHLGLHRAVHLFDERAA